MRYRNAPGLRAGSAEMDPGEKTAGRSADRHLPSGIFLRPAGHEIVQRGLSVKASGLNPADPRAFPLRGAFKAEPGGARLLAKPRENAGSAVSRLDARGFFWQTGRAGPANAGSPLELRRGGNPIVPLFPNGFFHEQRQGRTGIGAENRPAQCGAGYPL